MVSKLDSCTVHPMITKGHFCPSAITVFVLCHCSSSKIFPFLLTYYNRIIKWDKGFLIYQIFVNNLTFLLVQMLTVHTTSAPIEEAVNILDPLFSVSMAE